MASNHSFHPSVLRAYDVRGTVGETLSAEDAHALGRAFGTIAHETGIGEVAVGYDGRLSSPGFEAALVDGLVATGIVVRRIGLGPSPMLYYAVKALGVPAGIQVTGSHNPASHNGFKMTLAGRPFFGEDIAKIGRIAAAGKFAVGKGRIETLDAKTPYRKSLSGVATWHGNLSVIWDIGNGAVGAILPDMIDSLPGRHQLLNARVDGRFPAHHPDPTLPENLEDLRKALASKPDSIGVAFDGDGDRVGVLDEKSRILWGDQIVALLARKVLAEKPGATIIADVKASQGLFDEIARLGGRPLMWKTGHSPIKAKMAETGAPLAGEMSGHIFFADHWYGFDDALYAAFRLLQVVSDSGRTLAQLFDELPRWINTPEIRIDCPDDRKFALIEEVRERLLRDGAMLDATDGVRVTTAEGWWLLRASNTQPILVARCEAKSVEALAQLKERISAALRASGLRADL